jgi:hypothetical protein
LAAEWFTREGKIRDGIQRKQNRGQKPEDRKIGRKIRAEVRIQAGGQKCRGEGRGQIFYRSCERKSSGEKEQDGGG